MGQGSRKEMCPVKYVGLQPDDLPVNQKSMDFQSNFPVNYISMQFQSYFPVNYISMHFQPYFPVNYMSMAFQQRLFPSQL